eukprot:scaffold679101_cov57-Prasinocladus_malaysianus.AAC.1
MRDMQRHLSQQQLEQVRDHVGILHEAERRLKKKQVHLASRSSSDICHCKDVRGVRTILRCGNILPALGTGISSVELYSMSDSLLR